MIASSSTAVFRGGSEPKFDEFEDGSNRPVKVGDKLMGEDGEGFLSGNLGRKMVSRAR